MKRKVSFIGRGGVGNMNIRSPSRDAIRGGEDRSPETSPIQSRVRVRAYDREIISAIDNAKDTGVVCELKLPSVHE